jgi:hypothetical protein
MRQAPPIEGLDTNRISAGVSGQASWSAPTAPTELDKHHELDNHHFCEKLVSAAGSRENKLIRRLISAA